jgi:hypothetical protein
MMIIFGNHTQIEYTFEIYDIRKMFEVITWSNSCLKQLKSYGDEWRNQNAIHYHYGNKYLIDNRTNILLAFGINPLHMSSWYIEHSIPYPEPLLVITDTIGNKRFENGSYYSVS